MDLIVTGLTSVRISETEDRFQVLWFVLANSVFILLYTYTVN